MEPNHIYQYSLLNALMDGVSSHGIPVSRFLTKGNQGLGAFLHMSGELLLLDSTVYQLQAGGQIRIAAPDDEIPFGVATNFVAEETRSGVQIRDKGAVDAVLEDWQPKSPNLFLTYRISGIFEMIKCRTVRGQEYPGQPLSELGKTQSVETYRAIRGTVVGFRSPRSWQGFSVAGEHMHFIDEARKVGGHVLELKTGPNGVEVQMAVVSDVHIELPRTGEFNRAKLVVDDEGIKGVEG